MVIKAWRKFIKHRRESRSCGEIASDVLKHIEKMYAEGRDEGTLDDCLLKGNEARFNQVLNSMISPPAVSSYTPTEIRAGVRKLVSEIRREQAQQRAGLVLEPSRDRSIGPSERWNQDVPRSLALALKLMGTTAAEALSCDRDLSKFYMARLQTSRLGKTLKGLRVPVRPECLPNNLYRRLCCPDSRLSTFGIETKVVPIFCCEATYNRASVTDPPTQ